MIAFACSVASEQRWQRWALPGISRVAEPGALVIDERGAGSLQARCNRALEAAAAHDDLEAVVLLHEDSEIDDDRFLAKLRHRLADPGIAIIGAVGARGVSSIAWWEGKQPRGRLAGMPNIGPRRVSGLDPNRGFHDVDAVDGLLMVMSAWAVRELRFDEELSDFHGYDVDICFQARERGRRVVVDDLEVIHHSYGGIGERDSWMKADVAFRRKWFTKSRLWAR